MIYVNNKQKGELGMAIIHNNSNFAKPASTAQAMYWLNGGTSNMPQQRDIIADVEYGKAHIHENPAAFARDASILMGLLDRVGY